MLKSFLGYFTSYILGAKTRQRLLFLAMLGLGISAFALLVLQSTMGGLQNKLVSRSKDVSGDAVVYLKDTDKEKLGRILAFFQKEKLVATPEIEVELLIRNRTYLAPAAIHGIPKDTPDSERPFFLTGVDLMRAVVPHDLAAKLGMRVGESVRLISPSTVDVTFEDTPRSVGLDVGALVITDVPEIDLYHLWARDTLVQNLVKSREYNRIRLYGEGDFERLRKEALGLFPDSVLDLKSWETENNALVWALGLESTVMVFLFIAMTLLVSLCISSGLLIFFDKVKLDLASFWILGASPSRLYRGTGWLLGILCLGSIAMGLLLGCVFLWGLDRFGTEIMPAVFVDRKIPVYITFRGVLVSFLVPAVISTIMSFGALRSFRRSTSLTDTIKGL